MKKSKCINRLVLSAMLACLIGVVEAKQTTFIGTGDWQDPSHWDNGVPVTGDRADVLSGTSATIDGQSADLSVGVLGGELTVKNGALSVSDKFHFGNEANLSPKVTATNSDLSFGEFLQSNGGNGSYGFVQNGGTFKVTSLADFYGNNVSTMLFSNVTATFSGNRWSLYRAAMPSLWKFTGSTVANAASSGFLMGVWGNSTGELVFDHSTFDLSGTAFDIGYGNDTATRPATLRFENGSTVTKRIEVSVGSLKQRDPQDPYHRGWGRIVGVDSTWTNTALTRLYLGSHTGLNGLGSTGELILSNCTYWAETENVANVANSALCVGYDLNSTGRVQIVGGKFSSRFVYCGCSKGSYGEIEVVGTPEMKIPGLWIGYAAGAMGKLILHDKVQETFIPSIPGCSVNYAFPGAHRIIEYVDSVVSHTTGGNWNVNAIPGTDNGSEVVRLVDGAFTNTAGLVMIGGTTDLSSPLENFSGLELVRSKVRSTAGILVGRHPGMPGYLMLKDCDDVSMQWPMIGFQSGCIGKYVNEGSKVSFPAIYVCGQVDGATCYYRDGVGAETEITDGNKDFRIGDKYGTFDVELGGKLTCGRFLVGLGSGTLTGEIRTVPGAEVSVSQLTLGRSGCDVHATLCLNGGVLAAEGIWPLGGDISGCPCKIYFDGGTLKAKKNEGTFIHNTYARTSVGKGGAVFDSNGYNITTAIPLTHDDRDGAPAVDGGIVKKGAGTLKLTNVLSFTGGLRVEAGTLDLSEATYTATPSISGMSAGTLKTPASGLTVTGESKFGNGDTGVAVDGIVSFGPDATVTCDDPDALEIGKSYTLLTATSVTGTPKMDMPKKRGVIYDVVNTGTAIVCTAHKSGLILVVQ